MTYRPYSNCDICGAQVPAGHPCMTCVQAKRMKEDQKVITPENIIDSVSLLSLKDKDMLVIKSDELNDDIEFYEAISEGIHNLVGDDICIGLMVLPSNTEMLVLRKDEENNADKG